ncbi:hypothetical protein M413DRAFT_440167 [Hebeloma cylindrosporum]|uniref:Copper acquisition factor BIM1-like domain-containing protein n=1 Tax=Hebeloma cylindrosporum TaxID=76867 RepID=A0A0C3CI65_HEBCY|nr:hypothetical protein M413DRAFT_440167 [Hebeloma cylindrosporum h7]
MHSTLVFLFAFLAAAVNAHFQLQYPPPRGVFVEDDEPTFCDGYLTAVSNRSEFPLSGGFFSLNSEHPKWTAGVLISTLPDPKSFNNFSQVNSFFQIQGEGAFCIPLDFSKSNVTSLSTGQNVTIQIVFDGGDGQLYQCADLTLSNSFTIPTNVSCTNATSTATSSGATSTSTGAASTPKPSSLGVREYAMSSLAIPFTLIGAVLGLAAL